MTKQRNHEDPDKLHENTRTSEEGVEKAPAATEGEPATGLIGAGKGVDPRYVSQR